MGKWTDKTGMRFGKLVCQEYLGNGKWKCICDCGKEHIVSTSGLTTGKTKSCGCLKYKYHINENFFKIIDTEEKAYILGLFAADGNISKSTTNIKLELKYTDVDILEKIKEAMDYNFNLIHCNYKSHFPNSDKIYDNYLIRLNITNKTIHTDIQKYGLTPNKSETLDINLDLIPEEFIHHFLRGLWDGDGSISVSYNRASEYFTMDLTTSSIMYDKIYNILDNNVDNFKGYGYFRHKEKTYTKTLVVSSKKVVYKLLKYLYKDATIYLDRKYNKYLEIINILETQSTIPSEV